MEFVIRHMFKIHHHGLSEVKNNSSVMYSQPLDTVKTRSYV